MKQSKLKKAIKDKFGSVDQFCKLSGLSYWATINVLNGRISKDKTPDLIDQIKIKLNSVEASNEKLIKDEEREFVRIMLISKFKSMKNFCEKNPKFSLTFVSNVINGRRKKRDQRFQNLLNRCNK